MKEFLFPVFNIDELCRYNVSNIKDFLNDCDGKNFKALEEISFIGNIIAFFIFFLMQIILTFICKLYFGVFPWILLFISLLLYIVYAVNFYKYKKDMTNSLLGFISKIMASMLVSSIFLGISNILCMLFIKNHFYLMTLPIILIISLLFVLIFYRISSKFYYQFFADGKMNIKFYIFVALALILFLPLYFIIPNWFCIIALIFSYFCLFVSVPISICNYRYYEEFANIYKSYINNDRVESIKDLSDIKGKKFRHMWSLGFYVVMTPLALSISIMCMIWLFDIKYIGILLMFILAFVFVIPLVILNYLYLGKINIVADEEGISTLREYTKWQDISSVHYVAVSYSKTSYSPNKIYIYTYKGDIIEIKNGSYLFLIYLKKYHPDIVTTNEGLKSYFSIGIITGVVLGVIFKFIK